MRKLHFLLVFLVVTVVPLSAQTIGTFEELNVLATKNTEKRPVIIIPGILGSELINKHSGEKVWFSFKRSKDDDLSLPIAPTLARSRDNLVPGDILRSIKFLFSKQDFYGGVSEALRKHGDYEEGSFAKPPKSLRNKYFVFAYDWRRDNVESARNLIRKLEALKRATGEKNIKFDLVAHSMGGLIARYAAMYGNRDLGSNRPNANWAGGHHIDRILMFGTPNKGSADSLQVLLEGYGAIPGINLPFVQDLKPSEIFTMPATFQLLPHGDQTVFYDENLKKLKINIYDYRTWEKYGWSVYGDKSFLNKASDGTLARMENHLENVLNRAKKFHAALSSTRKGPVKLFTFGAECEDTLSAFVLRKDAASGKWETLSKPKSYTAADGNKIDPTSMREIMFKPGDGRVSKDSLIGTLTGVGDAYFACSKHEGLLGDEKFQRSLLSNLIKNVAQ